MNQLTKPNLHKDDESFIVHVAELLARHKLAQDPEQAAQAGQQLLELVETSRVAARRVMHGMSVTVHNLVVGNQAALVESVSGRGYEHAMVWLENSLTGPGLLPEYDREADRDTIAQRYFDEHYNWSMEPGDNAAAKLLPVEHNAVSILRAAMARLVASCGDMAQVTDTELRAALADSTPGEEMDAVREQAGALLQARGALVATRAAEQAADPAQGQLLADERTFSDADLDLLRQWYNCMVDVHPAYAEPADHVLAQRIFQLLGLTWGDAQRRETAATAARQLNPGQLAMVIQVLEDEATTRDILSTPARNTVTPNRAERNKSIATACRLAAKALSCGAPTPIEQAMLDGALTGTVVLLGHSDGSVERIDFPQTMQQEAPQC